MKSPSLSRFLCNVCGNLLIDDSEGYHYRVHGGSLIRVALDSGDDQSKAVSVCLDCVMKIYRDLVSDYPFIVKTHAIPEDM